MLKLEIFSNTKLQIYRVDRVNFIILVLEDVAKSHITNPANLFLLGLKSVCSSIQVLVSIVSFTDPSPAYDLCDGVNDELQVLSVLRMGWFCQPVPQTLHVYTLIFQRFDWFNYQSSVFTSSDAFSKFTNWYCKNTSVSWTFSSFELI